jgi:hypothetical protein
VIQCSTGPFKVVTICDAVPGLKENDVFELIKPSRLFWSIITGEDCSSYHFNWRYVESSEDGSRLKVLTLEDLKNEVKEKNQNLFQKIPIPSEKAGSLHFHHESGGKYLEIYSLDEERKWLEYIFDLDTCTLLSLDMRPSIDKILTDYALCYYTGNVYIQQGRELFMFKKGKDKLI